MAKRNAAGRFVAGASGNPDGRPKGSRNRLGEAFLRALDADFAAHGAGAIRALREDKPNDYVKLIAALLPRELKIETASDLSDEQLDARLRQLADLLDQAGDGGAAGGEAEAPGQAPPL